MKLAGAFAPLRHRNFAVVWTGSFVSNVGTWMQAAALGYYTVHLTQSAGWGAAVASAEFAPTALLGSFGGAMADRYSRKAIFMTATLAQAVFASLLTFAMATSTISAPVIALYALANGCIFALAFPAFQAILPELVPTSELGGAVGLSSASWNLGRVIGPVAGIFVYQQWGIEWVLAVNAASFFAVVVALMTITLPRQKYAPAPILRAIAEGFRFAKNEPGLRITMLALCLNSLFVAPFIGLIPAVVEKVFQGDKSDVGWLITAQGVGAVIMGVLFGQVSRRFGVRRVMLFAIIAGPIALIVYGLAPNIPVAVVAILFVGALYFAALSSFSTTAQLRAPAALRGRIVSLNQVILGTVYALSVNVEGQLGDRFGLRRVTVVGAALSLVILAVVRIVRPGYSKALDEPPAALPEPALRG
ncbi:MAG TPA: MFS transporter [Acidimicrobiales bacterium]|nr:MFS transporter [Acidimicrobiales bacterium]